MLRPIRIVGFLLLVAPGLVLGQVPKPSTVEVFGGFSYLNVRTYEREHFFNLATGVTVNINKHFGLTGDVNLPLAGPSESFSFGIVRPLRSAFRNQFVGPITFPPLSGRNTTSVSTALFGPRVFLRREKMTLFGHALAGVVRTKETIEYRPSFGFGSSFAYASNGPAAGFGGGIDVNLGSGLSMRIVQADYLRARAEGFWGNQLRLQTGVVVRLGKGTK